MKYRAWYFPLAFLVFSHNVAFSASFFISPSGSGTQCSISSPCALDVGLSKPNPGDEVILLDGTYNQPLVIRRGGTAAAPIVVRAMNKGGAVVLVPNDRLGRVWASYVTVRGITFDGAKTGGNRGAVRIGAGDEIVLPEAVHHVLLEQLHVRNVRAAAISITSGEHDVIVRDSVIENSGYYEFWGEGFYLGSKYKPAETVYNLEIYGNTVRGFTENGLETKRYSHHVKVHDNVFYNQVLWADYGGDPTEGNDGTITLDGYSHEVYSNTLHHNKCGMAAFVVEPEAAHRVYNNVVYDGVGPGAYAVRMKDWSKSWPAGQYPPSLVYNNTFYNLVSHSVGTLNPSILVIKNNIGLDLSGNLPNAQTVPSLFEDAANGTFHLVAGSVAVDRATAAPFSSSDFHSRSIVGTYRDYGAFEYQAASPPSPPSGLKVVSVSSGND